MDEPITFSHEGAIPSQKQLEQAARLAYDVRLLKSSAQVDRLAKSYDLDDGTQVYVLDLEYTRRVHMITPTYTTFGGYDPESLREYFTGHGLPLASFISGLGLGKRLRRIPITWPYDVPDGAAGVPSAEGDWAIDGHNFKLMPESARLFPQPEASFKLGLEPERSHVPFMDPTLEVRPNQWSHISPGNYTGDMAPMVQLMLGVAKQVNPDYIQRWLELKERALPYEPSDVNWYKDDPDNLLASTDESGYLSKDHTSGAYPIGREAQVLFDYRYNRTHGILYGDNKDGDKVPFLVEIGSRGVHVMPFPVDPASTRPEIQKLYEEIYPALAKYKPFYMRSKTLFEAIGGFPSGESFPLGPIELAKWARSGLAVKDTTDAVDLFYEGNLISTGIGWAFHPTRGKATNTNYTIGDQSAKYGQCFELYVDVWEKPDSQKVRNSVAGQVIGALGLTEQVDRYKAVRLPQSFAESIIATPDYDLFDAFEVTPDYGLKVRLVKISDGFIDSPVYRYAPLAPCNPYPRSPSFKFYEPILQTGADFEFYNIRTRGKEYVADGPIFSTYVKGSLEVLNFFYNHVITRRPYVRNGRQFCQFTGTWDQLSFDDEPRTAGYFYSNSLDCRLDTNVGGGSELTVTANRIGHADWVEFLPGFSRQSRLYRKYFGTYLSRSSTYGDKFVANAVSLARNHRSAYFVCRSVTKSNVTESESFSGTEYFGRSGLTHHGHIYNFAFHWVTNYDRPLCGGSSLEDCIHKVCEDEDESDKYPCFGKEPPSTLVYSVCTQNRKTTILSPKDNAALVLGNYYTPVPEAPPAYSEERDWETVTEWMVWGMGADLMHDVVLARGSSKRGKDQEKVGEDANPSWWRPSNPGCEAPPWYACQNFFGKTYLTTFSDIDFSGEIKHFGARPQIETNPLDAPFGVVE